jgi:hypothetical protein
MVASALGPKVDGEIRRRAARPTAIAVALEHRAPDPLPMRRILPLSSLLRLPPQCLGLQVLRAAAARGQASALRHRALGEDGAQGLRDLLGRVAPKLAPLGIESSSIPIT